MPKLATVLSVLALLLAPACGAKREAPLPEPGREALLEIDNDHASAEARIELDGDYLGRVRSYQVRTFAIRPGPHRVKYSYPVLADFHPEGRFEIDLAVGEEYRALIP